MEFLDLLFFFGLVFNRFIFFIISSLVFIYFDSVILSLT